MKLGTQTGSLINHLQARAVIGQPDPFIGMGATILSWTDRDPGTIVSIEKMKNGKVIIGVSYDEVSRGDDGEFIFTTREGRANKYFRREDSGRWESVRKGETGRWKKTNGEGLRIGSRNFYRDPSF